MIKGDGSWLLAPVTHLNRSKRVSKIRQRRRIPTETNPTGGAAVRAVRARPKPSMVEYLERAAIPKRGVLGWAAFVRLSLGL